MKTVLIVDDDKTIRTSLREGLEDQRYLIIEAANCKRMMEIVELHNIDIILLDLHLTDGTSINLIPPLREKTQAPLIIISGDKNPQSKVKTLDNGADDYIEKPFDITELKARMRANLRRHVSQSQTREDKPNQSNIYSFNNMKFHPEKRQLFDQNGESCELTIREFRLLKFLISHQNKALSREELCNAIREERYVPSPRSIDIKVTRLRKKIGDDASNPRFLKTVRGVGYMFLPEDRNI